MDDSSRESDTTQRMRTGQPRETSSWEQAVEELREWDPMWAETCLKMTTNPSTSAVLPRKTVEMISVALKLRTENKIAREKKSLRNEIEIAPSFNVGIQSTAGPICQ